MRHRRAHPQHFRTARKNPVAITLDGKTESSPVPRSKTRMCVLATSAHCTGDQPELRRRRGGRAEGEEIYLHLQMAGPMYRKSKESTKKSLKMSSASVPDPKLIYKNQLTALHY